MKPESLPGERWLPIQKFEGRFLVSNFGRVWRSLLNRIAPVHPGGDRGYLYVGLGRAKFRLNRVVAAAFIGPSPAGAEVNHIDGDKLNNRADNLEYLTGNANMKHASERGLLCRGSDCHFSKFTETDVRDVFELKRSGNSTRGIAARYGVTHHSVQKIIDGRSWGHLGLAQQYRLSRRARTLPLEGIPDTTATKRNPTKRR